MEHIKCDGCGKEITYIEDEEILSETHFNIKRSNKSFFVENDNIEVEEENVKMERIFCEECFLKILNESNTLGGTLYDEKSNKFIY